jgi:hypothetical protein
MLWQIMHSVEAQNRPTTTHCLVTANNVSIEVAVYNEKLHITFKHIVRVRYLSPRVKPYLITGLLSLCIMKLDTAYNNMYPNGSAMGKAL